MPLGPCGASASAAQLAPTLCPGPHPCPTGDAVFQTHENLEHLAMMEALLGPLPESMATCAEDSARKYFNKR